MDLTLSADEQEIVSLAEKVLRKSLPLERLQRTDCDLFDRSTRTLIAEQGWFGLTLDSECGGTGLSVIEEMLIFREIGRALGPVECLTIALAARVAARAGQSALARQLTAGDLSVALAVAEPTRTAHGAASAPPTTRAIGTRDASLLLVVEANGASLLELKAGDVRSLPCLDKSISMGLVDGAEHTVAAQSPGGEFERAGELLSASMLLGVAEATRDMIVEYAKQRHTFGRPIGAYQAVRHPCADMAVRCEVTRCQLFVAAVSLRDGRSDAGLQLDSAKVLANTAALQNVDWNIQLHGGIGVMAEFTAHFFMKRAQVIARCFGDEKALLKRIVDAPIAA